jgi:hypothetical protein
MVQPDPLYKRGEDGKEEVVIAVVTSILKAILEKVSAGGQAVLRSRRDDPQCCAAGLATAGQAGQQK